MSLNSSAVNWRGNPVGIGHTRGTEARVAERAEEIGEICDQKSHPRPVDL